VLGREVDDRGEHGADDHPKQLVPVEERHADPGRLHPVVERRPDHRGGLDDEEQIPPAPSRPPPALLIHLLPPKPRPFAGTSPEVPAPRYIPEAPVLCRQDVVTLERAMGIEPTTHSLGSCRSTTELRPRNRQLLHVQSLFSLPKIPRLRRNSGNAPRPAGIGANPLPFFNPGIHLTDIPLNRSGQGEKLRAKAPETLKM
jgi:hypothetical protein